MFVYQEKGRYFAQAGEGTEELVAAEIGRLGGAPERTVYRGVSFAAEREALYRIVYASRLPTRILAPLIGFDCHSAKYLYQTARDLDWPALLRPEETFAVRASVANSRIRHSGYVALKVKDAVADAMRERFRRRPDVDRRNPDLIVHVRLHANHATLLLDVSGGSLHRRGYRLEGGEAPLRETTAAALLEMAGWEGDRPLVDPMCGSGTILAEAWMRGCRIPAGRLRTRFGFERLPDFDRAVWERVRRAEDRLFRPLPEGFVSGSDADPAAVRLARKNLARLPGGDRVRVERRRFQEIPRLAGAAIVSNPPYGIRSVPEREMDRFWRELGDFLKRRCAGSAATLYFGERQWIRSIGLRPSWKRPLPSGGLDGRAVRYELYEGADAPFRKEKSMAKTTFKGDPVETSGDLPVKGAAAPAFTLVKGDLSEMSLADGKGKRLVLNVFPSIDTPVCAASVRRFNEEAGKLADTLVLCVSMDLPFAAARFCGAEGLENVVTLSDFRGGAFGKAYGLRIAGGPLAGLLARAVLVLDGEGKVVHSQLVPDIAEEPDYEAALAALR